MSQHQSSATKRVRVSKDSKTPPARTRSQQSSQSSFPATISAEQRRAMIAEAAYLRAAARGFFGGDPVADWLESEREVDALLVRSAD